MPFVLCQRARGLTSPLHADPTPSSEEDNPRVSSTASSLDLGFVGTCMGLHLRASFQDPILIEFVLQDEFDVAPV